MSEATSAHVPVQVDTIDSIGIATICNDHKANALSTNVIDGLVAALDQFASEHARAVVLRAKPGAKIFSAGHDVGELPRDGSDPFAWTVPLEQLLRSVREAPMPVIAMCEGSIWGGACDLVVSCDMVIASPSATLAMTPAKMGLPYNPVGTSHFLGVLPLHRLKEMLFTAQPMQPDEAMRLGVFNRVVAPDQLEDTTLELARQIARLSPMVIRVLKDELRELGAGAPLSAEVFERLQSAREVTWRSDDMQEGITAFFEKRAPDFKGH